MDLDIVNIDKNEKKSLRTIYESIDGSYFVGIKSFPTEFINICIKQLNDLQNIPTFIKNSF